MFPVYVTHHGETFTARYSKKSRTITGMKTVHPGDSSLDVKTGYQRVVAAIQSVQDFGEKEISFSCDSDLASWCESELGTSFAGIVSDSEAILALINQAAVSLPTTFQIVYRLEGKLKFILVSEGTIISQIHFAESELIQGIEALTKRSQLWYEREQFSQTPEKQFILGTIELGEVPSTVDQLFSDIESHYLVAAGIPLISGKSLLIEGNSGNRTLRAVRTGLLLISGLALMAALIAGSAVVILYKEIHSSVIESPYSIELTAEEQSQLDSLLKASSLLKNTRLHLDSNLKWSDYLYDFSQVSHDGVMLNRLGSRVNDGVLEFAFDGEATSEEAVTSYISALKESERFFNVRLTQMDRASSRKQRFRVQCSVQR